MQVLQACLHILSILIYPQKINDLKCFLQISCTTCLQLPSIQSPEYQHGPMFVEMGEIDLWAGGGECCEKSWLDGQVSWGQFELEGLREDEQVGVGVFGKIFEQFLV